MSPQPSCALTRARTRPHLAAALSADVWQNWIRTSCRPVLSSPRHAIPSRFTTKSTQRSTQRSRQRERAQREGAEPKQKGTFSKGAAQRGGSKGRLKGRMERGQTDPARPGPTRPDFFSAPRVTGYVERKVSSLCVPRALVLRLGRARARRGVGKRAERAGRARAGGRARVCARSERSESGEERASNEGHEHARFARVCVLKLCRARTRAKERRARAWAQRSGG